MRFITENMTTKLTITATLALLMCLYISSIEARPENLSQSSSSDNQPEPEPEPVDASLYNGDLSPHVIRQIQKCDEDIETMELCMRCAKVTKSEIVYPMCCDNEEGVKEWCHDYIYFGATPSSS